MNSTGQKYTTDKRVTVAVLRGLPGYKKRLKRSIQSIKTRTGKSVKLEHLLERGINLALSEYDEPPLTGRLTGRYTEKS